MVDASEGEGIKTAIEGVFRKAGITNIEFQTISGSLSSSCPYIVEYKIGEEIRSTKYLLQLLRKRFGEDADAAITNQGDFTAVSIQCPPPRPVTYRAWLFCLVVPALVVAGVWAYQTYAPVLLDKLTESEPPA